MDNENILKSRKKYKKYLSETKKLLCLKQELEELKNNPIVKRYLELKQFENKQILSERQMILYSFGLSKMDSLNSSKEKKIYIYMGAYNIDNSYDSRSDIKVADKDWGYADYLLYTNIDSNIDSQTILPKFREQFENNFVVLKFSNTSNIQSKYYDLQQFYFSQLLNMDLRKKGTILKLLKEKVK